MVAWIIVTVVCLGFFTFLGDKFYGWLLRNKKHTTQNMDRAGTKTLLFVLVFGVGIPIASTFFVEYPSLVGRPSVATFDSAGEPVYHKWGLVTLPWSGLEMANVPYPDECSYIASFDRYNGNTHFMVNKDGTIYFVSLNATICLENPSRYYARKENRRQGVMDNSLLKDALLYDLLSYQEEHLERLKVIVREKCNLADIVPFRENNCPALDEEMRYATQFKAVEQGFVLKVTSSIGRSNITNK